MRGKEQSVRYLGILVVASVGCTAAYPVVYPVNGALLLPTYYAKAAHACLG